MTRLLEQRTLFNEHIVTLRELRAQGQELPAELNAQLINDLRTLLARDEIVELFEKFEA